MKKTIVGTKYLLLLLPQIMIPAKLYGKVAYFDYSSTLLCFGNTCLYPVIYSMPEKLLCYKKGF
ncbi:MAG TPA: hypothetical protein PLZ77_01505 [Lachnospiraceae bacterium]|nr:hypothetical protein [Lachnospiraceae bacterium]